MIFEITILEDPLAFSLVKISKIITFGGYDLLLSTKHDYAFLG